MHVVMAAVPDVAARGGRSRVDIPRSGRDNLSGGTIMCDTRCDATTRTVINCLVLLKLLMNGDHGVWLVWFAYFRKWLS